MATRWDFFDNLAYAPESGHGDNRQLLLQAIAELAEGPAPDNIDAAAIRLSTKFPQSGLVIDEIVRRIEEALAAKGDSAPT